MDTITLIDNGTKLAVNVTLRVKSSNFRYSGEAKVFQSPSGYRGIAYRYHDHISNSHDDAENTTMTTIFEIDNRYNWGENDKVRIMSLNDNTSADFHSLDTYFEERIEKFEERIVLEAELCAFNLSWNLRNPRLMVYECIDKTNDNSKDADFKISTKKSADKISPTLTKADKIMPRLTKKDIILSIKR